VNRRFRLSISTAFFVLSLSAAQVGAQNHFGTVSFQAPIAGFASAVSLDSLQKFD
jgi:hypothetical protein